MGPLQRDIKLGGEENKRGERTSRLASGKEKKRRERMRIEGKRIWRKSAE